MFLCSPTKMDRGEGRGGWDRSINRKIRTMKFRSKLLSRMFECVRSLGDPKFRIKLGPWLLVDSNGIGRGWWSFVPWTVFQRGNGVGINGV